MWGLGGSGVELVVYRIVEELARKGHEVSIAALIGWGLGWLDPHIQCKSVYGNSGQGALLSSSRLSG